MALCTCKKCGAEFDGKFCPHCGTEFKYEELNKGEKIIYKGKRIFSIVVGVVILFFIILALQGKFDDAAAEAGIAGKGDTAHAYTTDGERVEVSMGEDVSESLADTDEVQEVENTVQNGSRILIDQVPKQIEFDAGTFTVTSGLQATRVVNDVFGFYGEFENRSDHDIQLPEGIFYGDNYTLQPMRYFREMGETCLGYMEVPAGRKVAGFFACNGSMEDYQTIEFELEDATLVFQGAELGVAEADNEVIDEEYPYGLPGEEGDAPSSDYAYETDDYIVIGDMEVPNHYKDYPDEDALVSIKELFGEEAVISRDWRVVDSSYGTIGYAENLGYDFYISNVTWEIPEDEWTIDEIYLYYVDERSCVVYGAVR